MLELLPFCGSSFLTKQSIFGINRQLLHILATEVEDCVYIKKLNLFPNDNLLGRCSGEL